MTNKLIAYEDIIVAIRSLKAAYEEAPEIEDEYFKALYLLEDALNKVDIDIEDKKYYDDAYDYCRGKF